MSQDSSRWLYNLSKDAAGLQILRSSSDATASSVISGSIPSNANSVTVTYYINRDETNPWQRFGNYSDSFTVSLFESLLNLASLPMDSKNVTVSYNAPRKADLSLVDSGGAFNISDVTQTLDFGTLVAGAAQGFDLILKFNAGARLLASSQNSGSLKHSAASTTVPYTFGFNGASVNLAGSATTPVSLMNTTGASPPSGTVLPIQITIGNIGGVLSGTYNDKVTFTIESTE